MVGGRLFTSPWEHFIIVEATRHWKYKNANCRYCGGLLTKIQPSRKLKGHILKCTAMPLEIREDYIGQELKARRLQIGRMGVPRPARLDEVRHTSEAPVVITNEEKRRFRMQVAMAFYTHGWAFRAIEDPAVRVLLSQNKPDNLLPTRQQLGDDFLVETFGEEKAELIEFLLNQGFVALVTDGWSNSRRESFVNFMLVGPNMRPLLWSCRVTGDDTKTGPYMATMIGEVIDEVEGFLGKGKVVAVTTDNASAMKSAWAILQDSHPGLMATGCTAHTVSLMMKDVLAVPELNEVLIQAQTVANFVRNHTATNSRFATALRSPSNIDTRRGLKIPIATRWYSHFECITRVMESERIIRELASDSELLAKYKSDKVAAFKNIVLPETFWLKGDMVLKLLRPIHNCIAHFEKDNLCLSVVFAQFMELKQHAVYNNDFPDIDPTLQAFFREKIQSRWEFIDCSPMRIAYMLDHTKDTSLFTTEQQDETVNNLLALGARLQYPPSQVQQIRKELGQFMEEKSKWGGAQKRSYYADSSITWWTWIGVKKYPLLSTIAQRVFTIPTSSAAAERSWSVFKYIHSTQRNRLTNEKVIQQVFIYSNHGPKSATSDVVAVTVAELDPGPEEARPPEQTSTQSSHHSDVDGSTSDELLSVASGVSQVPTLSGEQSVEESELLASWGDDDEQYRFVEWWGNIDPHVAYEVTI